MSRRARVAAALAALVLAAGSAVACGPDEQPEEPERGIEVSGTLGRAPVVVIPTPLQLAELSVEEIIVGEGRALASGAPALLSVTAYDGLTGEILADRGAAELHTIILERESVGDDLYPVLEGRREGTRLVLSQPVELAGGEQMIVLVIDVLPTRASGEPVEELPEGLPRVSLAEDGEPTIELPDADPSGSAEYAVLLHGVGEQVRPGQVVTLQYVVVVWPGGEIYDSTWAEGQLPRNVPLDDTFVGLRDVLIGQQVGSQVLVVVPPDLGTGDETLVVVADILATSGGVEELVGPATPEPEDESSDEEATEG